MLEFSKQKDNIIEVINGSLDFLLHENEIEKNRIEYVGISYSDNHINYITFRNKKEFLEHDFLVEELSHSSKETIERRKKEETKEFIILKFLETIEDSLITTETLTTRINEHFLYNDLDFEIDVKYLERFLESNIYTPISRKYKVDVTEQLIKNAYCKYVRDLLNSGKIPEKNYNTILYYLKNNDDTETVKNYIKSLNEHDYLRKDNVEPYLFQEIKEKMEVKYIYHFIKNTFKKLESFTKVKQFNALEFIKESYNPKHEYTITENDIAMLYYYHHKDVNELFYFLVEPYCVYELNKETKEKEVVDEITPLFRLNDKVFLQKILKELKKSY